MRAGERNNRLEFQRMDNPATRNEYGENDPKEPRSLFTEWAAVEELSGVALLKAQQIEASITTGVRVLSSTNTRGLIVGDLIKYRDGRTLEIAAPPLDPDGRRRELQLLCREAAVVGGGVA